MVPSRVHGGGGNVEFFLWASPVSGPPPGAAPAGRRMLIVSHTGRPGAVAEATGMIDRLLAAGVEIVLLPSEAETLGAGRSGVVVADAEHPADGCELVICLGGDGTILRGAELGREKGVAVLGVNLGHVGFLAEAEQEDLHLSVERVVARDYHVEERMAIDVVVSVAGSVVARSWALNEASVEKAARERMLEVVLEVDGRPLSTIGCDGVIMATPTGSTAYGFSAGGPVIWPEVEAMLRRPAVGARAVRPAPGRLAQLADRRRGARGHRGVGGAVVRRAPDGRAAPRRADRGDPQRDAGPAGPADRGAVHRPAGRQVRPAGQRLARRPRPADSRLARCSRRCGSGASGSSAKPSSSWVPA